MDGQAKNQLKTIGKALFGTLAVTLVIASPMVGSTSGGGLRPLASGDDRLPAFLQADDEGEGVLPVVPTGGEAGLVSHRLLPSAATPGEGPCLQELAQRPPYEKGRPWQRGPATHKHSWDIQTGDMSVESHIQSDNSVLFGKARVFLYPAWVYASGDSNMSATVTVHVTGSYGASWARTGGGGQTSGTGGGQAAPGLRVDEYDGASQTFKVLAQGTGQAIFSPVQPGRVQASTDQYLSAEVVLVPGRIYRAVFYDETSVGVTGPAAAGAWIGTKGHDVHWCITDAPAIM